MYFLHLSLCFPEHMNQSDLKLLLIIIVAGYSVGLFQLCILSIGFGLFPTTPWLLACLIIFNRMTHIEYEKLLRLWIMLSSSRKGWLYSFAKQLRMKDNHPYHLKTELTWSWILFCCCSYSITLQGFPTESLQCLQGSFIPVDATL